MTVIGMKSLDGSPIHRRQPSPMAGGFGDEPRASGAATPARGRAPLNDLDDDIPF